MLLMSDPIIRHNLQMPNDLHHPLGASSPYTTPFSQQPRRTRYSCLPLLLLIVVLLPASADAFVRRPNNGLLKLCPPGGESFTAAWEITCGMRRRKRSADVPSEYLPNVEDVGKPDEALQQPDDSMRQEPLTPPKNLWISLRDFLFGVTQTETDQPGKVLSRKERTTAEEEEGNKIEGAKLAKIQDGPSSTTAAMGNNNHLYRAPSMTEMMLFCCRYGCSLRDLMPYCDPFGEWDS